MHSPNWRRTSSRRAGPAAVTRYLISTVQILECPPLSYLPILPGSPAKVMRPVQSRLYSTLRRLSLSRRRPVASIDKHRCGARFLILHDSTPRDTLHFSHRLVAGDPPSARPGPDVPPVHTSLFGASILHVGGDPRRVSLRTLLLPIHSVLSSNTHSVRYKRFCRALVFVAINSSAKIDFGRASSLDR